MRDCPVYVRKIAIATGVAIPTNHDDNRTNREVNRSVMNDACLAASPEETIKQSEKEGKKFKPTVSTCIFLSKLAYNCKTINNNEHSESEFCTAQKRT